MTILKNMKVNGKDYPIYIMENKIHVWNHQPEYTRIIGARRFTGIESGNFHPIQVG